MASGKIKNIGSNESGTLLAESYGTLTYVFNPEIKLCLIAWSGNSNIPPTTVSASLPDRLYPKVRAVNTILTGNYIEAVNTGISVNTGAQLWTAGYLVYFTA